LLPRHLILDHFDDFVGESIHDAKIAEVEGVSFVLGDFPLIDDLLD